MKNIVIINSTFRKGGNSEALSIQFALGATESGHNVKIINLRDIKLNFCIGCLSCNETGKCVLHDGMNALLPVIQNADVLVFSTPVYYYCMSGQLKTFLDRLNPLFEKSYKFKQIYLLTTAAENEKKTMDGTIKGVQGWIDCFENVELSGIIYGTGADAIGTIQKSTAFRDAYEMGKNV